MYCVSRKILRPRSKTLSAQFREPESHPIETSMTPGQIIIAKTEYEIYHALRQLVSVKDFVEGHLVCCRFFYSAQEAHFVLDKMCKSLDLEKIYAFQKELLHEGFFCILDARGDVEEVTYGCKDFVALMKVTDMGAWTHIFEFTGKDECYEKHIERQAAQSLQSVKKLLAA